MKFHSLKYLATLIIETFLLQNALYFSFFDIMRKKMRDNLKYYFPPREASVTHRSMRDSCLHISVVAWLDLFLVDCV